MLYSPPCSVVVLGEMGGWSDARWPDQLVNELVEWQVLPRVYTKTSMQSAGKVSAGLSWTNSMEKGLQDEAIFRIYVSVSGCSFDCFPKR